MNEEERIREGVVEVMKKKATKEQESIELAMKIFPLISGRRVWVVLDAFIKIEAVLLELTVVPKMKQEQK